MTKTEKKQAISGLFNDIEQIASFPELEAKLVFLIKEIYSSGYDLQGLKLVSKTIDLFISDIPNKVFDNGNSYFRKESSKSALLTLIDLSLLSD